MSSFNILQNHGDAVMAVSDLIERNQRLTAILASAIPFIDDSCDAHEVMHESAASAECRKIVAEARALIGSGGADMTASTRQKPTPGPWHASMTRLGTAVDIGAANGANVAIVCGPEDNGAEEFEANGRLIAAGPELAAALHALVDAKALMGIRDLVAGWNGENRPEGPHYSRHPAKLGAVIPTNCGAVYALDDAIRAARAALAKAEG